MYEIPRLSPSSTFRFRCLFRFRKFADVDYISSVKEVISIFAFWFLTLHNVKNVMESMKLLKF